MKILLLSLSVSLIMLLSLLDINKHSIKINKNQISETCLLNEKNLFGNKTFTEVRLIRSTIAKDVFDDVITKYQYKDDPCPTDDTIDGVASNFNFLVTKYSI